MEDAKRNAFFRRISKRLGREDVPETVAPFDYSAGPQHRMMQNMTQDEIVARFKQELDNVGTAHRDATKENLAQVLLEVIHGYGDGKVVLPSVKEMAEYGLTKAFEHVSDDNITFAVWDASKGHDANVEMAQDANMGITFPLCAIAETATIVQASDVDSGRCIGLLPLTHIAIVRKDTIVPRMTQSMALLKELFEQDPMGFPRNIVHISGPSNTSDIELVRVVGVHGPINVTFILLDA